MTTESPGPIWSARQALFELYRRHRRQEWIQAYGTSMRPFIRPGSWMLVDFGATPQRVGEIVLFGEDEKFIAHRIVARSGTLKLVTKGDSSMRFDRPLATSDVIGVVRSVRHNPGEPALRTGCTGRSARLTANCSVSIGVLAARLGASASVLAPRATRGQP